MRQTPYHLAGHEILNKTAYFVKRYYLQILRYLRKCMKKWNNQYSFVSHVMNMSNVFKTPVPNMID